MATQVFEYPNLPFSAALLGGTNENSEIIISGTITSGPNNGFVVEYQSNDGVAMHMNVRMGYQMGTERVIVFNSLRCGRWEHEERYGNNLGINQFISLTIRNNYNCYIISINGIPLATFNHRQSPINVHTLQVRGDLRAERIQMVNFATSKPAVVVQQAPPPTTIVVAPPPRPAPTVVIAAPVRPAPTVVIAPPPRPAPAVVIAPQRRRGPLVEVVVPPPKPRGFGIRFN